ncbi:MAG: PAS domain-containing protein [Elainellaceae cyanobacterium]
MQPRHISEVLIVDDSDSDVEVVRRYLSASPQPFQLYSAESLESARRQLSQHAIDAVLLDLNLADSTGLDTLLCLLDEGVTAPVIVLTGDDEDEIAIEALHVGAQDYLIKGRFNVQLLTRSIRYAIERASGVQRLKAREQELMEVTARLGQEIQRRTQTEAALEAIIRHRTNALEVQAAQCQRTEVELEHAEKDLQHQAAELEIIFKALPDAIVFADNSRRIRRVSAAITPLFGYAPEELLGKPTQMLYHDVQEAQAQGQKRFNSTAAQTFEPYDVLYQRKDGSSFTGETIGTVVRNGAGESLGFVGIIRDVTQQRQLRQERDRAQAQLARRELQLQQFVKHMPAAVAMFDTQMRYLFYSDRWLADYGVQATDITSRSHYDVFPNICDRWKADHQECLSGSVLQNDEDVFVHQDGTTDWLKWELRPWYDPSGEVGGLLMLTEVITAQKKAQLKLQESLQESETRFSTFMDHSFAVTFIKDAAGRYRYTNRQFSQFAGLAQADIIGKTDDDWLPVEVAQRLSRHDAEVLETGEASQSLEEICDRSGNSNYWMMCKFPCPTDDGRIALGGIAIDITAQKRIEQELSREKELAQVTLQSIGDAVITTDARENVIYLNPIAERLTGWSLVEAEGVPLRRVFNTINEVTRQRVDNSASRVLCTGQTVGFASTTAIIAKNGSEYSITDSAAPIRDRDGKIIGVVLVFHDVTESRKLSQQLAWQASHDEMTGLRNRRCFELALENTLKRPHREHILCFLDLDQFKIVNDTCGHAAGDELLKQVGVVLTQNVRSTDIVARLGGDEFGIVLCECNLETARSIMDVVRQTIQDFRFVWQDKTFGVGVSIGVVELSGSVNTLAEALGAADVACYAAKERGRNRLCIYSADDQELSEQRSQQQWISRIQQALDNHQFQLYQQPIAPASYDGGEMHHCEILLRLRDASGKLVPPMAFIPAAERYGLMPAIDRWVVQTFFAQAERHLARDAQSFGQLGFYTLNLSGASINDEQFLPFLKQQVMQSAIAPAALCFEITETVAVSNLNAARTFIQELKALGCSFALDDFGSGMSSFGYLRHLAVDYIKIDGSFVRNLLEDEISTSIVEAITKIAHSMGLEAIAEQVENRETQQKLDSLGVDYVQGYGIGKPAPLQLAQVSQPTASFQRQALASA